MTTIIKGSTKRGQDMIRKGENWEGRFLEQVYHKCSSAKQVAFEECEQKYYKTPNYSDFGICSHNTFSFSVSWYGDFIMPSGEIEKAMFIETSCNSYVILLNR